MMVMVMTENFPYLLPNARSHTSCLRSFPYLLPNARSHTSCLTFAPIPLTGWFVAVTGNNKHVFYFNGGPMILGALLLSLIWCVKDSSLAPRRRDIRVLSIPDLCGEVLVYERLTVVWLIVDSHFEWGSSLVTGHVPTTHPSLEASPDPKARFTRVKQAQATGSHGEICEASASGRQWKLFHSLRLLYASEPGLTLPLSKPQS